MKKLIFQNITTWDKLKANYWGIPKAGNSSIKKKLLEKSDINCIPDFQDKVELSIGGKFYEHRIYHRPKHCEYISKEQALSNGFVNFTVVRNPYFRFLSMYKDLKRRGNSFFYVPSAVETLDDFLFFLEEPINQKNLNIHFRSQVSFVTIDYSVVVEKIFKLEQINNLLEFLECDNIDKINTIDEEIFLTDMQKEKVYNIFHKDFKFFGYKK